MGRCILVVEDEPLVRMDTVDFLEEAGLRVVEFDNADEAFRYAMAHLSEIGAIFTDVHVRGPMNGIDLARLIARASSRIKLLVTSGGFRGRPESLPAGIDYVGKPWHPRQVLDAVKFAVG